MYKKRFSLMDGASSNENGIWTNNMQTLISVIIPVYNGEKHLSACLESVLIQTHENLEIILINDGSNDDSGMICDEYAKKDRRIKVLHQKNTGVSAARNAGLDIASGEYIGFVDSDDTIEPDMFDKLMKAMILYEKQIAVCGHLRFHIDNSVEKRDNKEIPANLSVVETLQYMIPDRYFEGFLWNKLFNACLINEGKIIRFDIEIHFCEDLLFVSQCLLKSNGIAYVGEALYHYRLKEEGLMYSYGVKRHTELVAWKKVKELWGKQPYPINNLLQARYMEAAINLFRMATIENDRQYIPYFREKAWRYWREYFFSNLITLSRKFRSLTILMFPKASYKVWKMLKGIRSMT